MVGIYTICPSSLELDQWLYTSWAFGADGVWTCGGATSVKSTEISSLTELPSVPVVVIQPQGGALIQGTTSLIAFSHPQDALYLFGPSNQNLSQADLGSLVIHDYVYIPSTPPEVELHASTAGGIVLYDRWVKSGG